MSAPRHFDVSGIVRDERGVRRYARLPATLVEMLRHSVERGPHVVAVRELDGDELTYRQLWDSAAAVAGGLRAAGVGAGDRVAIRYGNGLRWVRAFLGTLLAGAVAIPVNTRLTDGEVAWIVADSDARVVLGPDGPLPEGPPYATEDSAPGGPAAVFYTSGTTGRPKGAVLSHENFLTQCENGLRVAGLPRDGAELSSLVSIPLFHVAACNSQLLPTLQIGGTTVVMPTFEVHRFLRAVVEERIQVVSSAPAIFWSALNLPDLSTYDLSGVGWATYGGAPVAPALVAQIMRAFPRARVGNGFGLTETSSLSTFLPHEQAHTHPDSVGFAAPSVDVALHEPDPDGVGELMVRGANVIGGYWRNPAATARAIRDSWLYTGDLARIDGEGRVYLVDRVTDMINRGGENVYCVEVENVLTAAPGVREVAVLAVSDQRLGERVGAVVVAARPAEFDRSALVAYARERLADFKVPQYVRVQSDPLPRNAGGKIRKDVLRAGGDWGPRVH